MEIVSFATFKGGVGKTMMAFNVASEYALQNPNKRVLLMDFDPQSNLTSNLGIDTSGNYKSLKYALENEEKPENIVVKTPNNFIKNIDILPANFDMIMTEFVLNNMSAREFIFKNYIRKNKDFFNQYDVIFADSNPTMSILNQNLFLISNSIILVAEYNDINSISGLEMFQAMWGNIREKLGKEDEDIKAILINKKETRTKSGKDFVEYILSLEHLKDLVLDTTINATVNFKDSLLECKPVTLFSPKHSSSKEIKSLIIELENKKILL